ncbi:hypothetical protein Dimus_029130 [Dionaea muscipula]
MVGAECCAIGGLLFTLTAAAIGPPLMWAMSGLHPSRCMLRVSPFLLQLLSGCLGGFFLLIVGGFMQLVHGDMLQFKSSC